MIEHADERAEFHEIEKIVRAAGDYLEVTDDLRPRTLEAARDSSRDTSTRSRIAVLAVVTIVLAVCPGQFRHPIPAASSLTSLDSAELYRTVRLANIDSNWSVVDAFRGLRERHASVIEDAFF